MTSGDVKTCQRQNCCGYCASMRLKMCEQSHAIDAPTWMLAAYGIVSSAPTQNPHQRAIIFM